MNIPLWIFVPIAIFAAVGLTIAIFISWLAITEQIEKYRKKVERKKRERREYGTDLYEFVDLQHAFWYDKWTWDENNIFVEREFRFWDDVKRGQNCRKVNDRYAFYGATEERTITFDEVEKRLPKLQRLHAKRLKRQTPVPIFHG